MPKAKILRGDCRAVMRTLAPNSVDSVVCDPPYELNFMGKGWDRSGVAFDPDTWVEAFRVLKPGGHLLAFGGTRTFHRIAVAIEDAGFEVRDQIGWAFGSGFPKSHNIGNGWGTALKPAWEPICVARKPLSERTVAANVLRWGTGAINVDGCRVGTSKDVPASPRRAAQGPAYGELGNDPGTGSGWDKNIGRWPANLIHDGSDEVIAAFPETSAPGRFPKNTGGIGTAAGIYGKADGRAQIERAVDDGSGSAARFFYAAKASKKDRDAGLEGMPEVHAKATNWSGEGMRERRDTRPGRANQERPEPLKRNTHPTVKPTALMAYLCRLVTPPGGTVLDPFMGSGSTGRGAVLEGFDFIGIEQSADYAAIARKRIAAAQREARKPAAPPARARTRTTPTRLAA